MIFRNEYWFLSNFYPCKIEYKGKTYYSAEIMFQCCKCTNEKDREFIRSSFTSSEGKWRGRQVRIRKDWNDVKVSAMYAVLDLKFSQNAYLLNKLRQITGEIVEDNTWGDTFWGKCNGMGQNQLGKLLMKIRDT